MPSCPKGVLSGYLTPLEFEALQRAELNDGGRARRRLRRAGPDVDCAHGCQEEHEEERAEECQEKHEENDDQARERHENRAQEGCADEAGSRKEAGKVEQDQADGRSQSGARQRRSQTDSRQHDDCRGDEGGSSEEPECRNGAVPARGQGIAFGWAIGRFAGTVRR